MHTATTKISTDFPIEDFSKDCPGTRYGASPARIDCVVCFSRLICHLFSILESQPSITVVFLFSNGRRTSPSLSYHSFPPASELRKHWLVALRRDEGANSRVSDWAPFYAVSASSNRFSLSFPCPRVRGLFLCRSSKGTLDSSIADQERKASRFLKANAVPSVYFLFHFFCARKSPCAGLA